MLPSEHFGDLLKTRYFNQSDYWDNVVTPILDRLGVPKGASVRRREFPITTHWGDRAADWLIFVGNRPMLVIEAEQTERLLEKAKTDAKTFAANFNPKKKEDRQAIGEIRAVPYVFAACGRTLAMFKLGVLEDGITPVLEQLGGLLTYAELQSIAERSTTPTGARPLERNLLAISQFRTNFEEISALIQDGRPRAKFRMSNPRDLTVLILNEILLATFQRRSINPIYEEYRLIKRVRKPIEKILSRYDLTQIEGPDLAYAYREFVTANFTGKGFGWFEGEVGRYLTPAPVIRFMVKMTNISPKDKVIDFACGSGGFLGAVASRVVSKTDMSVYLKRNLFACDADQFSVSTARTFMELLLPGTQLPLDLKHKRFYAESLKPGLQIDLSDTQPGLGLTRPPRLDFPSGKARGVLSIFHKNGLFSHKIHSWEADLSHLIQEGTFDVVISNPPGGVNYNLGHDDELKNFFPLESRRKTLQNAPLFIQRATQLTKSGGKICLIVPDGILANVQNKYLQDYIFANCQVKAVVSLPRGAFPNVPSKMNVLFMVRRKRPSVKKPFFMASVQTGIDAATGKERNLESELEKILAQYRKFGKKR